MEYNSNYTGPRIDELLNKSDEDNVGIIDENISPDSTNPVTSKALFLEFKNLKMQNSGVSAKAGISDRVDINGETLVHLDISTLPKGTYNIKVKFSDKISTFKIYQQEGKGLNNISYIEPKNGIWTNITIDERANWLLFLTSEVAAYTFSYILISESVTYDNIRDIETNDEEIKILQNCIDNTYSIYDEFEVKNDITALSIDVSTFPKKTLKFKCTFKGNDAPDSITIWQQQSAGLGNIVSMEVNSGVYYDITLDEKANSLLLFNKNVHNYTLSYELVLPTQITRNVESIKGLHKNIDDINDTLNKISEIVYTDCVTNTLSGKYISDSSGNVSELSGVYSIVYLQVNPGEIYKIRQNNQTGNARIYSIYNTSDVTMLSSDTCVESTKLELINKVEELDVIIPEKGALLAVSNYKLGNTVISKKELLPISKDTGAVSYSIDNDTITISYYSNSRKISIGLGKGGGNQLFDFRTFACNGVQNHYNDSDWIAPFKIDAVNNADGDDINSDFFTGGAHQYNNGLTGSTATARTSEVQFEVDGKNITNGSGYAANIKIRWVNYIQARNTRKADGSGREVLKQIIEMTFSNYEWNVRTILVPLEDIYLNRWYGYQFTGIGVIFNKWRYVNALNRQDNADNSGNADTIAMIAEGNDYNLEMWVNPIIDMGKREFNTSIGKERSAFKSGAKGYFWIADNGAIIKKDCCYYLDGKYVINLNKI